jgi:DNA-binding transcriptional ArsR family regulator
MRNPQVTDKSNRIFGALADPIRRSILELLSRGGQPAGRIAEMFPVSRPAVSKHLSHLRRARLVYERRDGRYRMYELDPEPLKIVDTWLDRYRGFWDSSLRGLKAYREREQAGRALKGRRLNARTRRRSK